MEEKYLINIDLINDNFMKKGSFQHNTTAKLKILPFSANDKNVVLSFKGVIGAFSRCISSKKSNKDFNIDEFINNVSDKVSNLNNENTKEVFIDIIQNLFINKDELVNFDIKTLNYIKSSSADEKIAEFIYSILYDKKLDEFILKKYDAEVDNILYKLALMALPQIKDKNYSLDEYNCYITFIKELFLEDFIFIVNNNENCIESLEKLISYYYVFYISQLIMKFSSFEKANLTEVSPIYFSLNWEKISKNRTCYKFGWDMLKGKTNSLLSHIITLQLLNHSNSKETLDYVKLFEVLQKCDQELAGNEIIILIDKYKEYISDVNWNDISISKRESGNKAFNRVYELFDCIEYQFSKSSRNRAYEAYKNWFVKYIEKNFGKRRGSLGYSLNITEDNLIFMTKICMKNNSKIKLKMLFEEFEKRGLFFDRDSKIKIIQLYEKLNLIEKKSDSGDAQYVKSIL